MINKTLCRSVCLLVLGTTLLSTSVLVDNAKRNQVTTIKNYVPCDIFAGMSNILFVGLEEKTSVVKNDTILTMQGVSEMADAFNNSVVSDQNLEAEVFMTTPKLYTDKCLSDYVDCDYNEIVSLIDCSDGVYTVVRQDGSKYYCPTSHFSLEKDNGTEYEIPEYGTSKYEGFKSWMPYNSISDRSTRQWIIREIATTDEYGFRKLNERYCVAVGTYFGAYSGQYIDFVLENGAVINAIVGDIKDDEDTDKYNCMTVESGCVSEFIISTNRISKTIKTSGDCSDFTKEWNSPVVKVIVYDYNIFS